MKIVSCALLTPEGTIFSMPKPARHIDLINTMVAPKESVQGFLTDYGTFVDRKEALEIAKASGQIVKRCGGDNEQLYSENLW